MHNQDSMINHLLATQVSVIDNLVYYFIAKGTVTTTAIEGTGK
jgi:hypothetical protein